MKANMLHITISTTPCDKYYNARIYKEQGEHREGKTHSIGIEGM